MKILGTKNNDLDIVDKEYVDNKVSQEIGKLNNSLVSILTAINRKVGGQ